MVLETCSTSLMSSFLKVDQHFTLLFDQDTSSRLLKKWEVFKPNVIKEAKGLSSTPELCRLLESAESPPGSGLHEATSALA